MALERTLRKRKKSTSSKQATVDTKEKPSPDSSAPAVLTTAQSVANCHLFKLPPELRNRVYEYAVAVDPEHTPTDLGTEYGIKITTKHGIPEPALLSSCKTIRREAIGIYYTIHNMDMIIENFDSTPLLLWKRKQTSVAKQYGLNLPTCGTWIIGGRSLHNLDNWLFRVHQNLLCDIQDQDDFQEGLREYYQEGEADMIMGMLEIAEKLKGKPWDVVDSMFDWLREVLNGMHYGWMERKESNMWW